MTVERPGGGTFTLSPAALRTIEPFRQRRTRDPEAGGILLGRVIVERPDVIADSVTTPSRWDRWTRFSFFRAKQPAQEAVKAAWATSGGEQNYLGEWHTHPEDHPTPSGVDLRDWERQARTVKVEQTALFFVITGRVSMGVWEVPVGGGAPVRLLAVTTAAGAPFSA